jgi:hypothetical protein
MSFWNRLPASVAIGWPSFAPASAGPRPLCRTQARSLRIADGSASSARPAPDGAPAAPRPFPPRAPHREGSWFCLAEHQRDPRPVQLPIDRDRAGVQVDMLPPEPGQLRPPGARVEGEVYERRRLRAGLLRRLEDATGLRARPAMHAGRASGVRRVDTLAPQGSGRSRRGDEEQVNRGAEARRRQA